MIYMKHFAKKSYTTKSFYTLVVYTFTWHIREPQFETRRRPRKKKSQIKYTELPAVKTHVNKWAAEGRKEPL